MGTQTEQSSAEATRERLAATIRSGLSVRVGHRIISRLDDLPSAEEIARIDQREQEAELRRLTGKSEKLRRLAAQRFGGPLEGQGAEPMALVEGRDFSGEIEELKARIDELTEPADGPEARSLNGRVSNLVRRVNTLDEALTALNERLNARDEALNEIVNQFNTLSAALEDIDPLDAEAEGETK